MNNYIDDPVFGHMEYRHRWFKTDEYEMFGKKWTLTVAAKAYSGKPITDAERASYQKFQENQQETLALLYDAAMLSPGLKKEQAGPEYEACVRRVKADELPCI